MTVPLVSSRAGTRFPEERVGRLNSGQSRVVIETHNGSCLNNTDTGLIRKPGTQKN